MKYRIFTNDVGPNAYSALQDIEAKNLEAAKIEAAGIAGMYACKALVLPHDRKDLFPNGQTGKIKPEARAFIVGRG